jgi:cytochrome P450
MGAARSSDGPQHERQRVEAFDLRRLPDAFYDDPYPTYHLLRRHDPVHRCPDGSWFLTRYADCLAVYRDHRRLSSDKRVEFAPKFGAGPLYQHHTTSMVFRDPPDHTRLRRLVQPFFTPPALAAVRPRVEALVDGMLDQLEELRSIDLLADYAFALPAEIVCDLLGVPHADRARLRAWAKVILGALEPVTPPELVAAGDQAVAEFSAYLLDLVRSKRRHGASDDVDVLGHLVHAMDDRDGLSEAELVQNCIFMLNAGHETTTNLIANGVNALLDDPRELERLRAAPGPMETGVDELLRLESSNQLGNRRVVEDVEIGGVRMEAGSLVTLCIGAANHDPAQFHDPDRLDLGRQPNRHLAFAAGIHTCAGANLGRLEAHVAIGRLVARFPDLHRSGPLERDPRARFRVVRRMPVTV